MEKCKGKSLPHGPSPAPGHPWQEDSHPQRLPLSGTPRRITSYISLFGAQIIISMAPRLTQSSDHSVAGHKFRWERHPMLPPRFGTRRTIGFTLLPGGQITRSIILPLTQPWEHSMDGQCFRQGAHRRHLRFQEINDSIPHPFLKGGGWG